MNEQQARKIVSEIQAIAKRNGLWVSISEDHRPDLKMIRVNEISIKIDGDKK